VELIRYCLLYLLVRENPSDQLCNCRKDEISKIFNKYLYLTAEDMLWHHAYRHVQSCCVFLDGRRGVVCHLFNLYTDQIHKEGIG